MGLADTVLDTKVELDTVDTVESVVDTELVVLDTVCLVQSTNSLFLCSLRSLSPPSYFSIFQNLYLCLVYIHVSFFFLSNLFPDISLLLP